MKLWPIDHETGRPRTDYTLRFSRDGTFQITVFTDLHFGENENKVEGPKKDAKTTKVMSDVLEREHSQLVVLNGDLISGDATHPHNASLYLDQVVAPIIEKDLPWASTYGNHECQYDFKPTELFQWEKRYKNSLTQNMISTDDSSKPGVTNYYLPVYSDSGLPEVPELLLWFFDSRGGNWPSGKRPDWVDESVVKWFKEKNSNLTKEYGRAIPSLAFFHIPLSAARAFQKDGRDPTKEPGVDGEEVKWQGRFWNERHIGYDVPFMTALSKTNGLLATFSGHDHENDWCFKWTDSISKETVPGNGVNVCYGRHAGYGGYGNLARGGRQILLKQDNLKDKVMTWIRLEDGAVTGNVTLNSTYGQDQYLPHNSLGCKSTPELHSAMVLFLLIAYLPLRLWSG
ncbi:Metallophosphoesterase [Aspergillus leporis]|uniref:Metallophosphoesterase n=1 Tax=Aspergillus leporis TaxID=41062 RepID=A0A5N5X8N0_9EURO|nr:Metallophosphoesterase [Aspergillus leporis]